MENVFLNYPKTENKLSPFLGFLQRNSEMIKESGFTQIVLLTSKLSAEQNNDILAEIALSNCEKKLFVIPDISQFVDSINNEIQAKELVYNLLNLPHGSKFLAGMCPIANGHLGNYLSKKCDSMILINEKSKIVSQWDRVNTKFL